MAAMRSDGSESGNKTSSLTDAAPSSEEHTARIYLNAMPLDIQECDDVLTLSHAHADTASPRALLLGCGVGSAFVSVESYCFPVSAPVSLFHGWVPYFGLLS